MADATDKGAPPAYQEVPPKIQEGYGYDQGYPPNNAPAGSGIQSSTSVVAKSLADTGHYDDAKRKSNVALGFIIASVILGIPLIVVAIVLK